MDKLLSYWTKRNKELLEEARYSTWACKGLINKYFGDIKNKRAIDLGCGYGLILDHLFSKGAQTDGLEICKEVIENYKNHDGIKVIEGDCRNIPIEDNVYDFVMSFGVIEHVKEWQQTIKEHFRICKPGGKVLIAVPYLFSPLYYAMVLCYLKKILKYGVLPTAGKGFSKKELCNEMEKYGKIVEIRAFDFCCILELLTRRKYFKLAGFLEKCFGFFGVMVYCLAEKQNLS